MRYFVLICIFIAAGLHLAGQDITSDNEGVVSYITSQNIYVKFQSTKQISVGDTLYVSREGKLIPALKVSNLSSISCVCIPISSMEFKVNDNLISKPKPIITPVPDKQNKEIAAVPIVVTPSSEKVSAIDSTDDTTKKNRQKIDGKLSLASYSNFSNTPGGNSQRMRYTFSMNAQNIGNSKFSAESYVSFMHDNKNWDEIKNNVFNGLKIYNLAVKYEPTENMKIWLGRKINPNLSNVGAIDGLQVENRFRSITAGAFVGSRPNNIDYSFDFNLFQFGAYLGHSFNSKNGNMQSTLAFVEQKNNWKTDRRFAYFQHYNALLKNVYFFGTAELELYQKVNGVEKSDPKLTNLYLMLRYRVIRPLSLSISYRTQSSMIYYETYDTLTVEHLFNNENVQGFRFSVNYRPIKYLAIGVKVGYRSSKQDPRPTRNAYGYISYSRIPWLNASATLSVMMLETSYLSGKIYTLGLSRDLVPGKLYAGISYRYVDYNYVSYETTLNQQIGDVNLTWRIMRKLSLSVAYEGIFESTNTYNRLYVNLIQRL